MAGVEVYGVFRAELVNDSIYLILSHDSSKYELLHYINKQNARKCVTLSVADEHVHNIYCLAMVISIMTYQSSSLFTYWVRVHQLITLECSILN